MPQYMRQGYGKMLIDFSEYLCYVYADLPTCTHFDLKVCWYDLSLWTTQNPAYACVHKLCTSGFTIM